MTSYNLTSEVLITALKVFMQHAPSSIHSKTVMLLRGEGFFEWWVCPVVRRHHSREGGWDTGLAGLAPSSQPTGFNIRLIHEQAKCSS